MHPPENIHCLALNYPGVGSNDAETPLYFVKSKQAYCESGAQVRFPSGVKEVWTEVELGIVIARDGCDIPPADAEAFIAGYVVCADISCENIYGRDHHLAFSKSRAGFCPCSGVVIPLPLKQAMQLEMTTEINGRVTQTGNTRGMLLSPADTVAYLSTLTSLAAGDLILTGTPPGYQYNMLKRGDSVRHRIAAIGEVFYDLV
ncbi:MAG: fumarylacetoacetate hydrolase family protein [Lentisphaerota bacterium]